MKMTLEMLLRDVECTTSAELGTEISAITSDSRKIEKNGLFICIKGMRSDGHDFAPQVIENGAAAVVCERDLGLGDRQIIVPSARRAFCEICENLYGRPLEKLKLVGITGTNGKTTTTYILKHILEDNGRKVGLIGTICNMIGDEVIPTEYTTPDTLELHALFAKMRDAGCDICFMEVSSQALEQGRVEGLTFACGCFTNLTQDHLDVHGTMENYFAAKCKIFPMSRRICINADDKWSDKIVLTAEQESNTLRFGADSDKAQCRASNMAFAADGVQFDISCSGTTLRAGLPIPGRFSVYNALAAVSIAVQLGVPFENAVKSLSTATGVKGRAEVYPTGEDFTVVIDYAHAPDEVENILNAMRAVMKKEGRLVALLGCGGDRDPLKRPIMGEAAAKLADFVIVTSDNPRTEEPAEIIRQILPGVEKHTTPYVVIENRREAIEYAICNAKKDDVIVLAGKGHETYQIIGKVKTHFDEREVLAEVFDRLRAEKEGK